MNDLTERISRIEALEIEVTNEAAKYISSGDPIDILDFFVIGALKRTLSQSCGFCSMIRQNNFPSAAILLRAQIDTAMRINGLQFLDNASKQLPELFFEKKKFRELASCQKTRKGKNIRMTDSFLIEKLAEREPWIRAVYNNASDFVHLSFRHFFSSTHGTNADERIVTLVISSKDNSVDEKDYYEICDAFLAISNLTTQIILQILKRRKNK